MTQNTDLNSAANSSEEKSSIVNIRDLIAMGLAHWYWFIISLAITLGLATFYILKTAPVYTRTTSILVKNDDDSSNPLSNSGRSQFGLFGSNLTIQNEILSLKSISLMEDVVERLNLQNSYSARKGLRIMDMYKANPVEIALLDSATIEKNGVRLKYEMHPDGKVTLSDFEIGDEKFSGEVTIPVGQSVQTPLGRIMTSKTPWFNDEMIGETYNFRHSTPLAAAKSYSRNITTELGNEDATIINISFSGTSVPKANDILKTLVDVYNERWIQDKNQVAVSTYNFINERLAVIEQELGEVDSDISSYKSQNLLPDLNATSQLYLQQSSQNQVEMMELNNQLYMAKFLLKEMNTGNITSPLPANTGIGNLDSQINEYNKMVLERNRLIAASSENNPLVTELTSSLKVLRTNIIAGISNTIAGLNNQIRSLQGMEAKATGHLAASPNQARYLLSVERQQKVKESLYLYLLEKREESQLSQAFTAYNTRLIDAPFGDSKPTSPKTSFIYAAALILGFLFPFGILFVRESLNTKVRGKRDVEDLSIPIMGEIPQIFDEHHKEKKMFQKKKRRTNKGIKDIVVRAGSRNVINEAFRVLRTNLEFMNGKNETGQVVMITSFNPGSGKSLITMNLAITLSLNGKKVIVVDGDLRRASSSAYVESPKKGLSNYLSGAITDYHDVIVSLGLKKGNVDVIPVGTMPPNPSELLAQPIMTEMIEKLKKEYDYIILDCPPVDIVADTAVLASAANRTIFVVRVGLLDRSMLPELKNLYNEGRFNNMSLILNCVPVTSGRYGYRYGYKYGHYGYGYGYGYGRYGYGHYGHYGHYGYYHSDDDPEEEESDTADTKSENKK